MHYGINAKTQSRKGAMQDRTGKMQLNFKCLALSVKLPGGDGSI